MIIPPLPDAFFSWKNRLSSLRTRSWSPARRRRRHRLLRPSSPPSRRPRHCSPDAGDRGAPATPAPEHLVAAEPRPLPDRMSHKAASGPLGRQPRARTSAEAVAAMIPPPRPSTCRPRMPSPAWPISRHPRGNTDPPPGGSRAGSALLPARLDPAIAADPELYDATIAGLHDPDAETGRRRLDE